MNSTSQEPQKLIQQVLANQNTYARAQQAAQPYIQIAERRKGQYLQSLKELRTEIVAAHAEGKLFSGNKLNDDFILYLGANTRVGYGLGKLNMDLQAHPGEFVCLIMTRLYPEMNGKLRLEWGLALGEIKAGEIEITASDPNLFAMSLSGRSDIEDCGRIILPTSAYYASFLRPNFRKETAPKEVPAPKAIEQILEHVDLDLSTPHIDGRMGATEMDPEDDSKVRFSISSGIKAQLGIPVENLTSRIKVGTHPTIEEWAAEMWGGITERCKEKGHTLACDNFPSILKTAFASLSS